MNKEKFRKVCHESLDNLLDAAFAEEEVKHGIGRQDSKNNVEDVSEIVSVESHVNSIPSDINPVESGPVGSSNLLGSANIVEPVGKQITSADVAIKEKEHISAETATFPEDISKSDNINSENDFKMLSPKELSKMSFTELHDYYKKLKDSQK